MGLSCVCHVMCVKYMCLRCLTCVEEHGVMCSKLIRHIQNCPNVELAKRVGLGGSIVQVGGGGGRGEGGGQKNLPIH
jgi:hypothetical protein